MSLELLQGYLVVLLNPLNSCQCFLGDSLAFQKYLYSTKIRSQDQITNTAKLFAESVLMVNAGKHLSLADLGGGQDAEDKESIHPLLWLS
jgi:hypothetical protein